MQVNRRELLTTLAATGASTALGRELTFPNKPIIPHKPTKVCGIMSDKGRFIPYSWQRSIKDNKISVYKNVGPATFDDFLLYISDTGQEVFRNFWSRFEFCFAEMIFEADLVSDVEMERSGQYTLIRTTTERRNHRYKLLENDILISEILLTGPNFSNYGCVE